ncbi:MAG: tetratricopeptide repeat protein [Myxococcota bacterium]
MNLTLFQQAQQLFDAMVEVPDQKRAAAIAEACDGDETLAELVRELFSLDDSKDQDWAPAVSAEPTSGLAVGVEIDRYVVERRLGAGGMAEVWAVRHTLLGNLRALKVLHTASTVLSARLIEEGRAQARLRHPNVVPVWDVFDVGGSPALLMPLIEGPTLAKLLHARRLTVTEACALFSGIVAGVESAHGLGLVHRDIKPANVLIDLGAGAPCPRVADFGLVKDQTPGEQSDTIQGVFMGTPSYASPEQIRSAADAGFASDVFSLGVVFYQMLTGTLPFRGASLQAIRDAQQHSPDLTPIASPLRTLVAQMLALQPEARPDCAAIRQALTSMPLLPEGDQLVLFNELQGLLPEPSAATFAPVVTSQQTHASHNLIDARDRFIGRNAELKWIADLLQTDRIITLLGPGGVGKTRLAREAARRVLSLSADTWPGGIWFCDLIDSHDRISVQSTIAAALGIKLGRDATGAIDAALKRRGRSLLVLDNLEHILDIAAKLISDWFEGTDAVFLNTSREPLRLRGEQRVPIAPLTPSVGIDLFVERATEVNPGFDASAADRTIIGELVETLDGLPLAIELAASRSLLPSPARLLHRVSQRFKLLRTRESDRPERQQTLYATLQWSWELLQPWEQAALAQCSVFEGGFSLDAAQAVVDLAAHDPALWIEDVLSELVEKSLLTPQRLSGHPSPRLSMLASVRDFARAKLSDPEAVERRHCATFAAMHDEFNWERWIVDLGNLRVACERAMRWGDARLAGETGLLVARLLSMRGPYKQGIDIIEAVVARFGDQLANGHQLGGCHAMLLDYVGRVEDSIIVAQRALADARTQQDWTTTAVILSNLGTLRLNNGQLDEARVLLQEALDVTRQHRLELVESKVLEDLSQMMWLQGDMDTAQMILEQARALNRRLQQRRQLGSNTHNLGLLHSNRGRFRKALGLYEEALQIFEAVGDIRNAIFATINIGHMRMCLGDMPVAIAMTEQAVALSRRLNNPERLSFALYHLGELMITEARPEEARPLLEESITLARTINHGQHLWGALTSLTRAMVALGEPEAALGHIQEALEIVTAIQAIGPEAESLIVLASVQHALHHPAEARDSLTRAARLGQRLEDPLLISASLAFQGLLDAEAGDRDAAQTNIAAAERTLGDRKARKIITIIQQARDTLSR